MTARADELVGNRQRINETAAHRLDVEGRRTAVAQLALEQTGGTWENEIRRRGSNQDEVEIRSLETCGSQRPAARFESQIARRFTVFSEMAKADPGATGHPLIAGLDTAVRQIIVADRLAGQKTADAGNARKHAMRSPAAVAAAQRVR